MAITNQFQSKQNIYVNDQAGRNSVDSLRDLKSDRVQLTVKLDELVGLRSKEQSSQHPQKNTSIIERLDHNIKYMRLDLADLSKNISDLQEDIEAEHKMDSEGIFGTSLLGRSISCVAQVVAMPATVGMQLAINHPYIAGAAVLGSQLLAAIAEPQGSYGQIWCTASRTVSC